MKKKKIDLVGGFLDTRLNNEDFVLTPYLFTVYAKMHAIKGMIVGLGIGWGWYSAYIGLGFNLPKGLNLWMFKTYNPESDETI